MRFKDFDRKFEGTPVEFKKYTIILEVWDGIGDPIES